MYNVLNIVHLIRRFFETTFWKLDLFSSSDGKVGRFLHRWARYILLDHLEDVLFAEGNINFQFKLRSAEL